MSYPFLQMILEGGLKTKNKGDSILICGDLLFFLGKEFLKGFLSHRMMGIPED